MFVDGVVSIGYFYLDEFMFMGEFIFVFKEAGVKVVVGILN